jgi:hypothetical protein
MREMAAAVPASVVPLHGRRRWGQKGVEPLLYDGVTFARCRFQSGPVENLHRASMIAD